MRRVICLAVALSVTFGMCAHSVNRAAAQEVPLPMPLGDETDAETELPLPGAASSTSQLPRDYSRAYLGVTFDPRVRDAAMARSVSAGSPADQAGVRAGDTIVSLNGETTPTYDDVLTTVAKLRAGDVLDIEISRRVSVRARAVLDGQPLDGQHTTSYRAQEELLPIPATYESAPRTYQPPAIIRTPAPRANSNASQSRSGNVNRNNQSNDRDRDDDRGRGRFLRRRG